MFTGLVEEVGRITSLSHAAKMMNITVEASRILDDVKIGDSIAVSGACLTVTRFDSRSFTVQAVDETVKRTTLSSKQPGSPVNLERSLRFGDRLGGHLVQGHVDGVGSVVSRAGTKDNVELGFSVDKELERYLAEKGSIAIDGVSLTVTYVKAGGFGVSVIPHTIGETTLGVLRPGNAVNLETDVIARYIERLMGREDALTMDRLRTLGY